METINQYQKAASELIGQCGDILHLLDGFFSLALLMAFLIGIMMGHAASGMFTRIDFYFRHVIRERARAFREKNQRGAKHG